MSIQIDPKQCSGCGRCVQVCPGNLIKTDESGRAVLLRERDCWGCASCLKECRFSAIRMFLGADAGGRGTLLFARDGKETTLWEAEFPDKSKKEILVNKKDANKY